MYNRKKRKTFYFFGSIAFDRLQKSDAKIEDGPERERKQ